MKNSYHNTLLNSIKAKSGKPTQHTFVDSYLGNSHPRYPINAPTLRVIAKEWMTDHRDMECGEFQELITSLIHGVSSTEKMLAGILLDYTTKDQREFDPQIFDDWLEHLIGWAEVDSVCTGKYTIHAIPNNWNKWKRLLVRFSKSENIQKRRASLVLLCSPMRQTENEEIALAALSIIERLKSEKEILITKAISWLLRSMIKHHKKIVETYVNRNKETLPSIVVRETMTVLKTGKKTKISV